ncbi:MAG TPA: hypothetical protein VGO40_22855 [Longimicrobium sp.]|jgi:hypothetical protein|nr:hypothetical protein [Longimicrobium sp.]
MQSMQGKTRSSRLSLDSLLVETFEAGKGELMALMPPTTHFTGRDSTCPCCSDNFTCPCSFPCAA